MSHTFLAICGHSTIFPLTCLTCQSRPSSFFSNALFFLSVSPSATCYTPRARALPQHLCPLCRQLDPLCERYIDMHVQSYIHCDVRGVVPVVSSHITLGDLDKHVGIRIHARPEFNHRLLLSLRSVQRLELV